MKAANEVSKDVVETMKLLSEKGYDLPETYAFFDMGLCSFYTKMLGNKAPETVAYLMESHHHERLKMVFGDKYNAMKRHIKK